jgi:hypothetical protein
MTFSRLSLGLLVCTACVDAPTLETVESAAWSDDQIDVAEDGCTRPVCGNAAKLFGPFYELDMTGTSYSVLGNYRIVGFMLAGGTSLTLSVEGFNVVGTTGLGVKFANAGLENAKFVVEERDSNPLDATPPNMYLVNIDEVSSIPYVEDGNVRNVNLPTFKLSFQTITNPNTTPPETRPYKHFVCPTSSGGVTGIPFDRHALFFAGNRYSEAGGVTHSGAAAHPWFNIACKDTAEWKAALFRLVAVAETKDFPSDPNDYSAAVRSIRADYCGDGLSHTLYGAEVEWVNRGGWLNNDGEDYVLEAMWDQDRAICLNQPRIHGLDKSNLECDIPTCAGVNANDFKTNSHLMATWVPAPPPILIAP